MTVAVSVNLSDGVVLAVDSAVSVSTPQGLKTYEDAEKLFQLDDRPIGAAIYGLGALGTRSVGSYLREFEVTNPVISNPSSVGEVVEELRGFLHARYVAEVVPPLEAALGKPFADMTPAELPLLGVVVGGFSWGAYLSEVWSVLVPTHAAPGSAEQLRAPGFFASNWFAMYEPIRRYAYGFDAGMVDKLIKHFLDREGREVLDPAEQDKINDILQGCQYQVPFNAMPLDQGVAHARFLVELVINHHRFTLGPSVVGGRIRIGKISYRGKPFELLEERT